MINCSALNDVKLSWPNGVFLSRPLSQETRIFFYNPSSKRFHQIHGDIWDDFAITDIKKTNNKMMIQSPESIVLYDVTIKSLAGPETELASLTGIGDEIVAKKYCQLYLDNDIRIKEFSDDRLIGHNQNKIIAYQWVKLSSCSMYVFTVFVCE